MTNVRLAVALGAFGLLAACGKTDGNHGATATATAGTGGNGAGAGGMAASGSAGEAGVTAPSRCDVDLDARCRDFELGQPRAFALRPDEYQNSLTTLFGVTVDVTALLVGPFSPYPVEDRAALAGLTPPGYREAAALAAERIANDPTVQPICSDDGCVAQFVSDVAPRVWRGSVSAEDQATLVASYDAAGGEPRDQLSTLLQGLLSSPRFFLRTEIGDSTRTGPRPLDDAELAAKLSYLFWNDTPDDELLDLARAGSLSRATVLVAQTRRLLADPRAAAGLANFYRSWLSLDSLDSAERDAALFPSWTRELAANMKRETSELLNWQILQGDATIDSVLTANFSFVSPDLAALYGVTAPTTPFGRVQMPPERQGLLTQASLLALTSRATRTSPVDRGVFVRERLLCQDIPFIDDIHSLGAIQTDGTLPEAYWVKEQPCSPCHRLLEPLGFGFERFDAIGRFRREADGIPITGLGSLLPLQDQAPFEFSSVPELQRYLAGTPDALACFAERALEWSGSPASRCSAAQAVLQTCQTGDLRETLAQLTATEAFRFVGPAHEASGSERQNTSCLVSGVSNCAYLATHSGVDLETCEACQGAPCDTPGCSQFGCQGVSVVHGCCSDEDCQGLTPFCGLHTGTHFVCVKDDAL